MDTPMRKLIRLMPDLAELVLDRCYDSAPDHDPSRFEFVEDTYVDWGTPAIIRQPAELTMVLSPARFLSRKWDRFRSRDEHYNGEPTNRSSSQQNPPKTSLPHSVPKRSVDHSYTEDPNVLKKNHPLMFMVKFKRTQLLQHRIVGQLLQHKWSHIRALYYLNLALYLLYLTSFSIYMLNVQPFPYVVEASEFQSTKESCDWLARTKPHAQASTLVLTAKYSMLFLALINLAKEIFQLCFNGYRYFTLENAMECAIFVLGLVVVADLNKCHQQMQLKTNWQWQCGSAGVFLAWLNLLLFLRRVPMLGIYVLMFTVVMRTFAKFFIVFLLFIVAFAFGFHALLSNHTSFNTLGNSLLKTTVMMLGELEFDSTFNQQFVSSDKTDAIFFNGITYTLFTVFIVLMTIVIMNLLVGLAVDDIKEVQNEAIIKRLSMQIELFLDIESVLPGWLRRSLNQWSHRKPDKGSRGWECLVRRCAKLSEKWEDSSGFSLETDEKHLASFSEQFDYLKAKSVEAVDGQGRIMRALHGLFTILVEMRSRAQETADEPSSVDSIDREFAFHLPPSPNHSPPSSPGHA